MTNFKGQVATEFFAYAAIFLLLVVITAASIFVVQDSEAAYYENQYIVEVGSEFASAYNAVVSSGDGTSYFIEFPKTVLGRPYNITFVENKAILVEWVGPHGKITYPYPMSHAGLDDLGCTQSFLDRKIVGSEDGSGRVTFINNEGTIVIFQEGCP